MKRTRFLAGTVLALLALAQAAPGRADEKFTAHLVQTSGPAMGKSTFLTISIKAYTTDEEAKQLLQALKDGGTAGLSKAIEKLDKGYVSIPRKPGWNVQITRSRELKDGKRRIMVVTNRPISFAEVRQSSRTLDYPFGIVQIVVDKDGKGEGAIWEAADIDLNEKGQIEIESYGIGPQRLLQVKAAK